MRVAGNLLFLLDVGSNMANQIPRPSRAQLCTQRSSELNTCWSVPDPQHQGHRTILMRHKGKSCTPWVAWSAGDRTRCPLTMREKSESKAMQRSVRTKECQSSRDCKCKGLSHASLLACPPARRCCVISRSSVTSYLLTVGKHLSLIHI